MEKDQTPESEKLELEIKKMRRDLDSNFEERKIQADIDKHGKDHRRSMLALWLSIMGPVVTIFSLFLTLTSIQNNQKLNDANLEINQETLRQKKLERVDRLKAEFDNSTTLRERRASIAFELMTDSMISKYDRDRYANFYSTFYSAVSRKEEKASKLNEQIEAKSKEINQQEIVKLNAAEEKQIDLEYKLNYATNPNQVSEIIEELKTNNDNISKTSPAVKLLDTLWTNQKELTRLQKESSLVQPEVTWFKPNYYRAYEDLIITLTNLNVSKDIGTVRVSKRKGENDFQELYTIEFNIPGKKTFTYNNNVYVLDFIKIDRAGKNPFTKAVYFSISRMNSEARPTFDDTFDKTFN